MNNNLEYQIKASKLLDFLATIKHTIPHLIYTKIQNDLINGVAFVARMIYRNLIGKESSKLTINYYEQLEPSGYHPTIMDIRTMLFLDNYQSKNLIVNGHIHCR